MYGYPNSVGIIRISLDLIRYEFFLSKSNLMVNFTPKVPVGRPRQRALVFFALLHQQSLVFVSCYYHLRMDSVSHGL